MSSLKNKKNITGIASVFILTLFILPVLTHAGLVPCGNPDQTPCDFTFFIQMINDIITWIISMATVIFTISAIYGGFLYMTSGDNPGNKEKAKGILWNTILGFVIILASWLIIFTILNALIPKDSAHQSIFNFIGGIRY